jgi:hypothetical protein
VEIKTGTEIVTATEIAMATHKDRETGTAGTIKKVEAQAAADTTTPKAAAEPHG